MPSISDQDLSRLRANVEELSALNEIAVAINLSMSVEHITKIILDKCLLRVPASQGAVFLLEDASGDVPIFHTFLREISASADDLPLHLNWTLLGWIIKNRQILAINDTATDGRFQGLDFKGIGINSVLAAPLIAQSGLIGALVLFNKKTAAGFTSEEKRFLGIVGSQTAKVIENARLFEKERKLLALEEEMKVARSIQKYYLPRSNLRTEHWEILGYNQPAKEVGGDYYDMFRISEDEVVISIGDVAGKGIPAALLASEAQAVIRSLLQHNPKTSLTDLTRSLNKLFVEMTSPEQYITAFMAVYNSQSGFLNYVNAGHNQPLLIHRDGRIKNLEGSNLVVGAVSDVDYSLQGQKLDRGDTLLLYTDGITENFDPQGEEYGEGRLRELLYRQNGMPLEVIRDELIAQLTAFRKDSSQPDDITFLTLRTQ